MRIPGESRFPRHRREDGTAKPDVFQISSEKVRGLKIKAAALPNSVENSGKQLVLTRSLIAGLASLDIEAISLETDARVVKELASYSSWKPTSRATFRAISSYSCRAEM